MSFLAYHGIGAYVGQRNPLALRRMLVTALTGVELCVSERAIGAFGAVFEGAVRAAFATDVWSTVESGVRVDNCRDADDQDDRDDHDYLDGRCAIPYGWVDGSDDGVSGLAHEPRFEPAKRTPSVAPANQRDYEEWTWEHHNQNHHAEAWMRATALRALWVKAWAPTATKKAARLLANSRCVPLFVVSGKSDKIWNLLDDVPLWGDKYPRHDYSVPVRAAQPGQGNAFTRFFERKVA